ncbi:nicotinate phosphoribosyltransferase [Shewanella avicenniae]|uniref:Nicotinate phosphoribosyltransferase n=1 Tax=Shewanella avicenniae TaxID=2814294 RepID=A0ABX7QP08_9GAMM|nr:nicotinate phosphoribosyltransferase [Shewanella avicenniae]QSX33211.1 nicotinate phosphoribosyltransferase [Shewanella avicenniae]
MFQSLAVQSLLDTDFYKLTMQQAYLHQQPNTRSRWTFRCRSNEDLSMYVKPLREQFDRMAEFSASDEQLAHLAKYPFLKSDYLEFLRLFRFNPKFIDVSAEDGQLVIEGNGPLLHVSPMEIPVLATVSEIRNRYRYPQIDCDKIYAATQQKIQILERLGDEVDLSDFLFTDFGTRRRFSFTAQKQILTQLKDALPDHFAGTSNPHLAMELGLRCQGTMAHEWLQSHQALNYRLVDSQKMALENWVKEYRGDLGVALTDVIGVDAFCRDLDRYLAKLYDGFRHDSGDPIVWGEKIIKRLEELDVDPTYKRLVFSDALDFERAVHIYKHFRGRINTSFGIGTWLMGNMFENEPINIVMKLTKLNGMPVAKISDTPGKTMCDDENFLRYLMQVFQVEDSAQQKVLQQFYDRDKLIDDRDPVYTKG